MPKSSQTSFKAKSSSNTEAKSKNVKHKSKKSVKPSSEPAPSPAPSPSISSTVPTPPSSIPAALTIPTFTSPSLPKLTTHASVPTSKNISKSTKEAVVQGESMSITTSQVKLPLSKLDVLVSAINVAPLDTGPPTSDKSQVEEPTIETNIATLEKGVDATDVMHMIGEEGSKEPVQKEVSDCLSSARLKMRVKKKKE
uniref:Flocculation protein FLO11-like n=1 Tax=Nicotiana tabacum TaxID=4097 RepID=A0A1S4AX88_TOBAC|nr:PREDICTED: flocculation protein FLO11-like [Nicotiana tabacum]